MKTLFRSTTLLLFCISSLFLGGCEQHVDITQDLGPQFEEGACEGLSTSELDLSEGFRGSTEATGMETGPDFQIFQHGPQYSFVPGVQAGDNCQGICTFRVTFETVQGATIQTAALSIASINLNYDYQGSTFIHNDVAFTWSYPTLDINEVYYNTINNYDITFESGQGQSLSIVSTEVLGGLCVIENIDKYHIPGVVHIAMPATTR